MLSENFLFFNKMLLIMDTSTKINGISSHKKKEVITHTDMRTMTIFSEMLYF